MVQKMVEVGKKLLKVGTGILGTAGTIALAKGKLGGRCTKIYLGNVQLIRWP